MVDMKDDHLVLFFERGWLFIMAELQKMCPCRWKEEIPNYPTLLLYQCGVLPSYYGRVVNDLNF
jgi:hypothetical protein